VEPEPETEETGTAARRADRRCQTEAAQKVVGWIIGAILIFLAQRDLRKRPPELVRGRVGVWRSVAMLPPGAVVYLLFGRRRALSEAGVATAASVAD